MGERLLTPREAAGEMRISYAACLRLVHLGRLPAIRVTGKLLRVPEQGLRDYLAGQMVRPKEG